ncbi:hypothetical protein BDP27DRAFT_1335017 [Rhodocollybia butyracea]|uniref:Uncharacterized protein n=1 Tax=Rhodocollybia butyracea TaxID=206335 RepID=A0A9P5U249_9AGAR|nr:hypothetical protein BDP27DRAFT_1335017 [Rhodocollybia butyracea]
MSKDQGVLYTHNRLYSMSQCGQWWQQTRHEPQHNHTHLRRHQHVFHHGKTQENARQQKLLCVWPV